jgi:integrase
MHIKRFCQFLLDKEKHKTDAKLRFRIKWNNNASIVAFSIGYRVEIDKWSTTTQRCFKNTTHGKNSIPASVINKSIVEFENFADTTFIYFENLSIIPTADDYKKQFNILRGKETAVDLNIINYINMFTSEMGKLNQWSVGTYKKFKTLANHFENFNGKLKLNEINNDVLTQYMLYLIREIKMRNSSVKKHISILKWFLRWAHSKGYYKDNSFITFKPKLKIIPNKLIFLDWNELMTIYNFNLPAHKEYLERVRDVFCFCCFTSLRYSDVANLKHSNVFTNHLTITTVKTSDTITIDLNDYSRAIIKKYENKTYPDNSVLPVISNQRMNEYIKELGEICKINESIQVSYYIGSERFDETYKKHQLLTTHTGRRTFICISLMLGIQPNVVMKWTGHSDYKSMKPYIDITDDARKSAMNMFNLVRDSKNRD